MGEQAAGASVRQDDISQRVRDARLRLIARSGLTSGPVNVLNAAVMAVFLAGGVSPLVLAAWLAAVVVVSGLRLAVLMPARKPGQALSRRMMGAFLALSFVMGSLWGVTPWMVGEGASAFALTAAIVMIGGMTAGSALTSAAAPQAVLAYNAPAMLISASYMAYQGGLYGYLFAGLMVLFLVVTCKLARGFSATLTDAVRSNFELEEVRRQTEAQASAMMRLAEHNDLAARRAEDQARANAAVLANMSHELRTPLNGVLGMAHLLEEAGLEGEPARMAKRVRESGQSLACMLSDVVDVARIEAGRLELNLEDVTAAALAEKTRRMFEPQAALKGLRLDVELEGESSRALRADEGRVFQMTRIFVANAIRFTEEGSIKVTLRTQLDNAGAARLHVIVRDTGSGVPESARPRLFDSLTQDVVDPSIREHGTGLGLHLTKRLAGLMQGRVGYEPGPADEGSVFWFDITLPVSVKADRYADGETLSLTLRRLRMLVAESDPARRSVLLGYLKSFNCAVTCVGSSPELVSALGAAAYDAVVVGLAIEDCEPEEAADDVRSLPSTASMTPVVRLVHDLDEPVRQIANETQVRAPVSADHLKSALEQALAGDVAAAASLRRIA
ncbi:ATP-binding protein [Alkalicaulis satelles]|nr:ATP-binding protein [Alkalicaulis satelles]